MNKLSLSATIKIRMTPEHVEELIGQDPMGDLDKEVLVTIGGHTFQAMVEGYAQSAGYDANLTLCLNSETRPEVRRWDGGEMKVSPDFLAGLKAAAKLGTVNFNPEVVLGLVSEIERLQSFERVDCRGCKRRLERGDDEVFLIIDGNGDDCWLCERCHDSFNDTRRVRT